MHLDSTDWLVATSSPLRLAPVTSHEQAVFWVQLASLLLLALLLGALANRIGQPPVVGQLLAGIVLGPTVFGEVSKAAFNWFLPEGAMVQSSLLLAVSTLSLAVLLLTVGFETDITLLRRLGRPASWVTAGSLLIPLVAGLIAASLLPAGARGPSGTPLAFSLLVGIAIAASSLPVIAEIVSHLGVTRRDFGQITLAAGTVNDAAAFVLIALAVALAGGGAVPQLARVGLGVLVLGGIVLVFAQPLVDRVLSLARLHGPDRTKADAHPSLAVCLVAAMVAAALVQLVGIEGALGAFVAGVILARSRFGDAETFRFLTQLSSAFFAPLYFATAGLEANLLLLGKPQTAVVFAVLVAVGVVAKFAGSYIGATIGRLPNLERVALGVGLNGRGTVQVIAGTVGLAAGIIGSGTYTAIVAMSLVTSMATPPLLRRVVSRWEGSPAERRRLDLEARMEAQTLVTDKGLLVLANSGDAAIAALQLTARAWPEAAPVTVVSTVPHNESTREASKRQGSRPIDWVFAADHDVATTVSDALKLGYGAVIVASGEDSGSPGPRPDLLTKILPVGAVPLVILPAASVTRPQTGERPERLLVPISASRASHAALELGYSIGEREGRPVHIVHIDTGLRSLRSWRPGRLVPRRLQAQRHRRAADAVLTEAIAMSRAYSVQVSADNPSDRAFETSLAAATAASGTIILGVRPVVTEDSVYFGEVAALLLDRAPERTIMVALPG